MALSKKVPSLYYGLVRLTHLLPNHFCRLNPNPTPKFLCSLDMEAGKRTVKKTLKIFNQDHLDLENAKYISCLRPMSGDDVPIIG